MSYLTEALIRYFIAGGIYLGLIIIVLILGWRVKEKAGIDKDKDEYGDWI